MRSFKTVHCQKCHAPVLIAGGEEHKEHKRHTVYCCGTEYHVRYKTSDAGEPLIDRVDVIELPNIDVSPFQTGEYPFEDPYIPAKLG